MIASAIPWWGDALVAVCVLVALFIFVVAAAACLLLAAALIAGKPEHRSRGP